MEKGILMHTLNSAHFNVLGSKSNAIKLNAHVKHGRQKWLNKRSQIISILFSIRWIVKKISRQTETLNHNAHAVVSCFCYRNVYSVTFVLNDSDRWQALSEFWSMLARLSTGRGFTVCHPLLTDQLCYTWETESNMIIVNNVFSCFLWISASK